MHLKSCCWQAHATHYSNLLWCAVSTHSIIMPHNFHRTATCFLALSSISLHVQDNILLLTTASSERMVHNRLECNLRSTTDSRWFLLAAEMENDREFTNNKFKVCYCVCETSFQHHINTTQQLNIILSKEFTIVSEMTYNVSSGTLNTTIPYHLRNLHH